jgi:hypothetical protein
MKPTPELTTLTTAFHAIHNGIKGDALALKIKMYFAGLLVNELTAWHRENIGETRGGDQTESKSNTMLLLLKPWLEEQLGVTYMTCRRYQNFFLSIAETTHHTTAVEALNEWWAQHKPTLALPATGSTKKAATSQALTLQVNCNLIASDMQALLEEADTLGLHELFERPAKDVTPEEVTKHEDKSKDRQLELALSYWGPQGQVIKAINRKAYLHLPKPEREALANTLEEALEELKDTLRARR